MTDSPFLAGIFFADDDVIWATASVTDREFAYPGMVFRSNPDFINKSDPQKPPHAQRFPSNSNAADDVAEAVARLAESADISKIEAVTTASIGPFQDGISGLVAGGTIISGARLQKWSGFDLAGALENEFAKYGNEHVIVRCLTDAEAMVLGEHYHFRQFRLRGHTHGSKAYREKEYKLGQDTVAYILLDSGVGGAVFQRNYFKRGEASLEIGHTVAYPPPGLEDKYPVANCGAHYLPCLEGTISLPALKEFWHLTAEDIRSLGPDSETLRWLSFYIAQAVHHMTLFFTPTVVLLGGRVVSNPHILEHTRTMYEDLMKNERGNQLYPDYKAQYDREEYIKLWSRPDAGVLGCLCWSFRSARHGKDGRKNVGYLAEVGW